MGLYGYAGHSSASGHGWARAPERRLKRERASLSSRRRLHAPSPYGRAVPAANLARDTERSDPPCERIGSGVHVRGKRCGDMLGSECSRHVTKGLLCVGRRRRRKSQDDVEGEAGAADRPLDICYRILRWKSGSRSVSGRNLWSLPRRGHVIVTSSALYRVESGRDACCSIPGESGGTPTQRNARQSGHQGVTRRGDQDGHGPSRSDDAGCSPILFRASVDILRV